MSLYMSNCSADENTNVPVVKLSRFEFLRSYKSQKPRKEWVKETVRAFDAMIFDVHNSSSAWCTSQLTTMHITMFAALFFTTKDGGD